jgi:XTP/dITP diphosphohydrolase
VLGGRPGVYSASFAGPAQKPQANNAKLLKMLNMIPASRRQARFVCCMALGMGGRLIRTFQGNCPGSIALQPAGRTGFGYDPVFVPRGYAKTMAQLGPKAKDRLSHRSRAARRFRRWLKTGL